MVEMSIVISVFLLLVLGMIEMSQMGITSQLLTRAATAGCRVAAVNGRTQADVSSAVSTLLASGGIQSSSYTLTTTPSDVTTTHIGDTIKVTISVPLSSVSWSGSPMFLGSSTVTSTSTKSSERP